MSTEKDFETQFNVSRETTIRIASYHSLLVKWNKAINIVSPKSIPESWERHFIDSAQISKFIPENTKTYVDLGCGGGFPGLVIAMMRPELDTHLVESDERKCQFMRNVSRETSTTNVTIHTKRIEDAINDISPNFITARALASLETLFDYIYPWVEADPKAQMAFMKGQKAEEEITEAQKRYTFDIQSHTSITDDNASILAIQNLMRKP
ncbi:MAG: 16S rRNA (guanine(527)-N(7))-methyltransferase RsmG [Alphaproteobacteria bacterium]